MIKIFDKDPRPSDLILAYGALDDMDGFEAVDRLVIVERMQTLGHHFAILWGLVIALSAVLVLGVVWALDTVLGFPTDTADYGFIIVFSPILAGMSAGAGVAWVINAYRDALQVVINER